MNTEIPIMIIYPHIFIKGLLFSPFLFAYLLWPQSLALKEGPLNEITSDCSIYIETNNTLRKRE